MAATNIKILNAGDKTFLRADAVGTGALAAGDILISNLDMFPIGSTYFDTTNRVHYIRLDDNLVIGDWCKSAAYTVAT